MFLKKIVLLLLIFWSLAVFADSRVWMGGDARQNFQAIHTFFAAEDILRVWSGGDVRQNFQAVRSIQTKAGVCRMWPGGTPGQNFRAEFCARLDRNGVWRIWRGGDVGQNHQAVFSAKQFSDGTLRVWRGGDVRQNFQAVMTIGNADEHPRGVLLFIITGLKENRRPGFAFFNLKATAAESKKEPRKGLEKGGGVQVGANVALVMSRRLRSP